MLARPEECASATTPLPALGYVTGPGNRRPSFSMRARASYKLASPVKIIKKKRKKMAVPPSDRVLRSHVRSNTPEPLLVKEEDITARVIQR